MAYSSEQVRDLTERIDAALTSGSLNAWQTTFLTDIKDRFARYGTGTRLSDKQVNKIYEILGSQRPLSQRGAAVGGKVVRLKRQRRETSTVQRRQRQTLVSSILILLGLGFGALAGYLALDLPTNPLGGLSAIIQQVVADDSKAIVGRASVIDGDTLEIHGTRIRLHGIDAPESDQLCSVGRKKSRCGQKSALALADKIGSRTVSCDPRDVDRYNRVVAVCSAGGEDLNAWMVASGWAIAYRYYSTDYIQQEEKASASKLGIWQGDFVPPWEWRQGERLAGNEVQQQPKNCVIKGNISINTGERIYHVPGGYYYDRTKITTSKGERWFCSEAEARAAGWRRSKR